MTKKAAVVVFAVSRLTKAHPATQAMSASSKPADLNEAGLRRNPGEPDAQQAEAGTYNKPRIKWQGLTIAIENPAGSVRRGRNRHGVTWEVRMRFDYGEILGTMGVDGDPVDVIVGPNLDAPVVYVVHQRKVNDWENYDEDKCCLGFDSEDDAKQAFLSNYNDPRFLGPITAMPVDEFVSKVRATRDKPAMIKAHISGYTRKDGVAVAAHEDKRAKHSPEQMAKWAEEKRQREQAQIKARVNEDQANRAIRERMAARVGTEGAGKEFTPDEVADIRRYIMSGDRHGAQAEGNTSTVRAIQRKMSSQGYSVEHVSESHGGNGLSIYVKVGDQVVRVSDHELPETAQRQHNRSQGLTGKWDREVVVSGWSSTSLDEFISDVVGQQSATVSPHDDNRQKRYKEMFSSSLGISREDMPQVPSGVKQKFLDELKASGVSVEAATVDPSTLKPTQGTYNAANMDHLTTEIRAGRYDKSTPILVSSDNRVLDGHHRWAVMALEGHQQPIIRIGMPAAKLLEVARKFNAENGIESRGTNGGPTLMSKASDGVILFFKAHVGPYLRGGKLVNLSGYQGRTARAQAAPGQLSLFVKPSVDMSDNRYKDKHPVHDTPDLFEPQHTEPTSELIKEHERLVDVLRSPSHEDDKVEAKKQAAELKEYKQEAKPQPSKAIQTLARRRAVLDVLGEGWKAQAGIEGARDAYKKVYTKPDGGKVQVLIMPQKTVDGNFYVGSHNVGGARPGAGSSDSSAKTIEEAKAIADRFGGAGAAPKTAASHPTDTPEFKRWFGASKVVDADGKPLVVYHGTDADITEFDPGKLGLTTSAKSAEAGFFFASSPKMANAYPQYDKELLLDYGGYRPKKKPDGMMETSAEMRDRINRESPHAKYEAAKEEAKAALQRYKDTKPSSDDIMIVVYGMLPFHIEDEIADSLNDGADDYRDRFNAKAKQRLEIEKARISGSSNEAAEFIAAKVKERLAGKEAQRFANLMEWSKQSDAGGDADGDVWEATKTSKRPNIMPLYLSIQNPLVFDFGGASYRERSYADLLKEAKENGHDGAIFRNTADPTPGDVFVAFNPKQIKSAIGNNGKFDPDNPDITKSDRQVIVFLRGRAAS